MSANVEPNHVDSARQIGRRTCDHCGLPVAGTSREKAVFCCAGCRLVHGLLNTSSDDQAISSAMLRIGLGIFFAMNLMVFSYCFYGAETLTPHGELSLADAALDGLFRWLLLLLGSGVMLTLWMPLAADAWHDLRERRLQAGLLIVLGSLAAYGVSAWSVLIGDGPMYFDSAAMILLLVTIGLYVEARMKTAALRRAEGQLLDLPDRAVVETEDGDESAGVEDLVVGQVVRVCAGSAVPIDGEVVKGRGAIDAALISGEAEPQECEAGTKVYAGSIVVDGVLWLRVISAGTERRIERIVEQIRALRTEPTQMQRLADRIAGVFVPGTLVFGLMVFGYQWIVNDAPMDGVMRALAVALIACPCALGLTSPLVVSRLALALARRGIVVRSARALELAGSVGHVFFDKTGTLTTGEFAVDRLVVVESGFDVFAIAAALQRGSNHPLARAWHHVAGPLPVVEHLEPRSGVGVTGEIGGVQWSIGRADPEERVPEELRDLAVVVLRREAQDIAWFGLRESTRPEAGDVVLTLQRMGLTLHVLTGDAPVRAQRLGAMLQLNVQDSMTPEMKRDAIAQERRQSGQPVAFVGDGINDALALAEADLGVSVAGGSDLAHASGQVSLLDCNLRRFIQLIRAGRLARRRIMLALGWSFGYNSVGMTLAVLGWLTPVFAAVAMIISSAVTIGIAMQDADGALDAWAVDDESSSQRSPKECVLMQQDDRTQRNEKVVSKKVAIA